MGILGSRMMGRVGDAGRGSIFSPLNRVVALKPLQARLGCFKTMLLRAAARARGHLQPGMYSPLSGSTGGGFQQRPGVVGAAGAPPPCPAPWPWHRHCRGSRTAGLGGRGCGLSARWARAPGERGAPGGCAAPGQLFTELRGLSRRQVWGHAGRAAPGVPGVQSSGGYAGTQARRSERVKAPRTPH